MDSERCTEDDDVFLATFDTFYPKKCYTPFSASQNPKIFASLFSMPDNQSILKILWVYRFCSLSEDTIEQSVPA